MFFSLLRLLECVDDDGDDLGMNIHWDYFVNRYDTGYMSSADGRDNRHIQFVREFASVFSAFQVGSGIDLPLGCADASGSITSRRQSPPYLERTHLLRLCLHTPARGLKPFFHDQQMQSVSIRCRIHLSNHYKLPLL